MSCRDFHDLLQQRLDGPGAEIPAAYEEHLRACPDCAALDGAARCLVEGLRLQAPPAPPAALADRIIARALRLRRRRRGRRRVAVPLALAACLLVAIVSRLYLAQRRAAVPERPGIAPTEVARPQEPVADSVGIRESVAEAGQAVASWTSRTAGEAVGEARRLLPRVKPTELVMPELEPPARTLRQAGEEVRAGLAPVKESARRAVDVFLREVPMDLGENRGP
jgi:predicted anti-sigma-YlaC factor YlaD